jgi:hypothetical protein
LNTLDWSWVCPDSVLGTPFLHVVKAEQFYTDVVSPIVEDLALGLGKGVKADDNPERWAGRYNLEDRC